MSIDSSIPGIPDHFDTGPLSWMMEELRITLGRVRELVSPSPEAPDAELVSAWRQAGVFMHQAHGALQMIDLEGVTSLTAAGEDLLARVADGRLLPDGGLAGIVIAACQALTMYLDEVLDGSPQEALKLYPYYRALRLACGNQRANPGDLYFPKLAIIPQLPPFDGELPDADPATSRQRFEKALLPFLKGGDPAAERAAAGAMAQVLGGLCQAGSGMPQQEIAHQEVAHHGYSHQGFWWVLYGFASGVAGGDIPAAMDVKQLFGRINLQMRKPGELPSDAGQRLMRDALFFIASAEQPSLLMQRIRQAYQLAPIRLADIETPKYGNADAAALSVARGHLNAAKSSWDKLAGGDQASAAVFCRQVGELAQAFHALQVHALDKLLSALESIGGDAQAVAPDDGLALEVAASLLFMENALRRVRIDEEFSARAVAMTARLHALAQGWEPDAPADWLDRMSQDEQQRQLMPALTAEIRGNLAQVEKLLDEFFGNPAKRTVLAPVDGILHQVEGALAILDQDQAVLAVGHVRQQVAGFSLPEFEGEPGGPEFRQVALNVGALSFFLESLEGDEQGARAGFVFDLATGQFQRREAAVPPVAIQVAPWDEAIEAQAAVPEPAVPELAMPEVAIPVAVAKEAEEVGESLAGSPEQSVAQADEPSLPTLPAAAEDQAEEAEDAVDAELLEIFLSEAVEVLDCIDQTLPLLHAHPHDQEYLTMVRRSFHTLKGSGRMVGLNELGEAAWAIEKTLNLVLADSETASPVLLALLENASAELGAWVDELRQHGFCHRVAARIVRAAEQVRAGEPMEQDIGTSPPAALDFLPEVDVAILPSELHAEPAIESFDEIMLPFSLPEEAETLAAAEAAEAAPVLPEWDEALEALAEPHAEETAQVMEAEAELESGPELQSGLEPVPQQLAQIIEFPEVHQVEPRVDDNIKRIGDIEISLPLHNIYLAETDELLRLLIQDIAEWRHEAHRNVNIAAVHAAHSLAGSSATVGFASLQELAHQLEILLQTLSRKPAPLLARDFDILDQSLEHLKSMLRQFALGEMPPPAPLQVEMLEALRHDLLARAESGMPAEPAPAPSFAPIIGPFIAPIEGTDTTDVAAPPGAAFSQQTRPLAGFAVSQPTRGGMPADDAMDAMDAHVAGDAARTPRDELDPDLLPVFLEESNDLLPRMQALLRAWQAEPSDLESAKALMRLLHTIKGSARMAGAMRFGQHMHEMESRIEHISLAGMPTAAALEDLLARFDLGLTLYDSLQRPQEQQAAPASEAPAAMQAPAAAAPAISAPMVRVRADILDRLVNQAGEVSISRSRVESEVAGLQQSVSDLTENVHRLRSQLREMEIQAESQMASQMAHSAERGFDPLEFDRFTRLQELTRMMAETVSDVVSLQQNLARGIDGANGKLRQQSRLTRELQQDLMRVRMVQFASIAERLYRVTRQTAKELDKRVSLDIHGGTVEIDRGVLEKMAGPFEHLLRNAIVHGIEPRAARLAAGKKEVGELLIEIRQEGNEVVIQFADDGGGLDLERIREKGRQAGLIPEHAQLSDAEVRELIFHPGFSTASEVTELAGRGIGMDVVRSEAAALGGRVAMESEPGKGTRFMIRLPLTLAVTQVVVLSTGGNTYAVPSVLVEQVQQFKSGALADAYKEGAVAWRGGRAPLYYLSELLGDGNAAPISQQYSPILVLRSGDERVAVHVDEVIGNREVVVKNIGPQLARMAGVAGATVLGTGDIVLILDPVLLAQRMAGTAGAAGTTGRAGAAAAKARPVLLDDSADILASARPGAAGAPRSQPLVMVVDDSLTVRRVTQRILAREGYQVILAKDGVDALQQLQSITPDVMLVDIEMPRMDGFDLTRNVRDDSRTRHIPIIMITSRTATKHRNYAMELGVNEYLGKPYQDADLLRLVSAFVCRTAPVA